MATWKSDPLESHVYVDENYHHKPVIYEWVYSTSADVLSITAKLEDKVIHSWGFHRWELEDPEKLLFLLSDWMGCYEGLDKLTELLKPIYEKYSEENR